MSDQLLDLFLRSTEDYAIILFDPDGRVQRWSRGAEKLFGFSTGELEGTLAHEIFVPPDRQAGVPEVEFKVATAQGRAEDERWHLRKDGSRFWASGVMISLKEDGRIAGYAKVVRDFTERRQLEEAVRQTQRLESVGVLAAGVAHDFNNVLTAILGNVAMVRRRLDGQAGAELQDMLLAAERAGNRAAHLVKQLLNYAGKGRREIQPVDISQVARDALAIVQASVSRKISLRSDIPQQSRMIQADVGQVQQLLLNLVLNGAEAIGDKEGEVFIRVRVRDIPEPELNRLYSGFSLQARQYTEIVVSDTGSGMDEKTVQQIFDPFFTTKFLGRGLGLAAALGIVRAHGGGIAVQSTPGKGSTFSVLLPAEQERPEAPMTVADSLTESARGEGLVLVIDDEVGIRSLLQHALEELGYTVLTAEHGAQGVELFERSSEEIILVLIDLIMPVLDGAETAIRIRELNSEVPILITSGIGDDDALRRFGEVRISGFVPKPFSPDQLAQAIAVARQGLDQWAGKERRQSDLARFPGPERRGSMV
ncbi:MAG: response regulator [Gemmatimonadales bacterium]